MTTAYEAGRKAYVARDPDLGALNPFCPIEQAWLYKQWWLGWYSAHADDLESRDSYAIEQEQRL